MIEIGGRPILWHIMKYYSAFGMQEFIICCGYKGYCIKEYFANYALHRSDITFDFTQNGKMTVHSNWSEPWKVTLVDTGADVQTGGRIKRVAPYIGEEDFMLTYGDGVSNVDLEALRKEHAHSNNVVTLTGIQPRGRFGVLDIAGDQVTAFKEKAVEASGWINGGFMVAKPELLEYIDGDDSILEQTPFQCLARDGKLGVYKHTGYWQCLDTQRDKALLEQEWAGQNAPWKVWQD